MKLRAPTVKTPLQGNNFLRERIVNTETNVTPLSNIISLKAAKENKNLKTQDAIHTRYLKVLSFSQLIDETSYVIEELNHAGSTKEMIQKSKQVLEELGERLGNSHGLSESFTKMKDQLQSKLQEINH